jgi:hypothetical protein
MSVHMLQIDYICKFSQNWVSTTPLCHLCLLSVCFYHEDTINDQSWGCWCDKPSETFCWLQSPTGLCCKSWCWDMSFIQSSISFALYLPIIRSLFLPTVRSNGISSTGCQSCRLGLPSGVRCGVILHWNLPPPCVFEELVNLPLCVQESFP